MHCHHHPQPSGSIIGTHMDPHHPTSSASRSQPKSATNKQRREPCHAGRQKDAARTPFRQGMYTLANATRAKHRASTLKASSSALLIGPAQFDVVIVLTALVELLPGTIHLLIGGQTRLMTRPITTTHKHECTQTEHTMATARAGEHNLNTIASNQSSASCQVC